MDAARRRKTILERLGAASGPIPAAALGAELRETLLQLTERLEKKLQETPHLDTLESYTLPGQTTIFVGLRESTDKKIVPDCWYQVRKKAGDIRHELPAETLGPYFDDEFGETYGIIYAFTAAGGFSHRELKDLVFWKFKYAIFHHTN